MARQVSAITRTFFARSESYGSKKNNAGCQHSVRDCAIKQKETKRTKDKARDASRLTRNNRTFPATNLEFVSVWIFKKASIIAATVGATDFRAFQASPADLAHEPGEPIHFFTGLSPKSESRSVGLMASILREAEKRFRLVSASRIEDSPPSARAIAGKTERWQELAIKLVRELQIAYAQVNMVEVARLFHFRRYF
jgi:hypothetical protein